MKIMESKWIQILLLFTLCTLCLSINATHKSDVGNANDYVDATLDNLRKDSEIAKYIHPVKVPDIHQFYFAVKNLKIWGLLSLYRHGDCSLTYDGDTVNVVAEVAVKSVYITLDYTAYAVFFMIYGDAEIDVDHLAVKLDFSSTNGNARLNSLKVVNLGNYRIKRITGLTFLFNWLLRSLANVIAQSSRQNIINALENHAGNAIGDILKKYKLPIL